MNDTKLQECKNLSYEILGDFESSRLPISDIILKCLRLCNLLGDKQGVLLFTYESSGYPCSKVGITPAAWEIAVIAGRVYNGVVSINPLKYTEMAYLVPLGELEERIAVQNNNLPMNPYTTAVSYGSVNSFFGNKSFNVNTDNSFINLKIWFQKIKSYLYAYILQKYNTLMYGNVIEDTFSYARLNANEKLAKLCPESMQKFIAVYNNMDSNNPEDWANAVHSCRRILLDLADVVYPAQKEPIIQNNGKPIQVGKEQYINRLMQFIESKKDSRTYLEIVGSDLSSIGQRLDAVYDASNKGTHSSVSKSEAARYIIHTYLLVSDIVDLI